MGKDTSTSKKASMFSLEEQFTFYASYHSNPVNKAIHFVCIWPILWTGLALFASIGVIPMPSDVIKTLPLEPEAWNLHFGTPIAVTYIFIYLAMDAFAGGLAAVLVIACYLTSNMWVAEGGSAAVAGVAHVCCWVAQFYGHGIHEGRAPALLDSFFQAFLAAPLFVLCELLFELGYKADMQKRMKEKAGQNIAEFHASKAGEKIE